MLLPWANRISRNAHPSSCIQLPVLHTPLVSLSYDVNLVILQRFIKGCCYLVPIRYGMAAKYLALRGIVAYLNILPRKDCRKAQVPEGGLKRARRQGDSSVISFETTKY